MAGTARGCPTTKPRSRERSAGRQAWIVDLRTELEDWIRQGYIYRGFETHHTPETWSSSWFRGNGMSTPATTRTEYSREASFTPAVATELLRLRTKFGTWGCEIDRTETTCDVLEVSFGWRKDRTGKIRSARLFRKTTGMVNPYASLSPRPGRFRCFAI